MFSAWMVVVVAERGFARVRGGRMEVRRRIVGVLSFILVVALRMGGCALWGLKGGVGVGG